MCQELCDANDEMQSCQDCGKLICFDCKNGDDIMAPAYVTSSGDLFCNSCGRLHDMAEDSEDEGCSDEDCPCHWDDQPDEEDDLDNLEDEFHDSNYDANDGTDGSS